PAGGGWTPSRKACASWWRGSALFSVERSGTWSRRPCAYVLLRRSAGVWRASLLSTAGGAKAPPELEHDDIMSTDDFTQRLRVARWGALLALLTVFFGFCLGGVFGAFEDAMKKDLADRAASVLDSAYGGDAA